MSYLAIIMPRILTQHVNLYPQCYLVCLLCYHCLFLQNLDIFSHHNDTLCLLSSVCLIMSSLVTMMPSECPIVPSCLQLCPLHVYCFIRVPQCAVTLTYRTIIMPYDFASSQFPLCHSCVLLCLISSLQCLIIQQESCLLPKIFLCAFTMSCSVMTVC